MPAKLKPRREPYRFPKNWREDLIIRARKTQDNVLYTMTFKKGTAPKGYDGEIGTLEVERDKAHIVDGPNIESKLQRLGLGTMMYERAIRDLGYITTDWTNTTPAGRAAWRSLTRRFPYAIDMDDQHLTVYARKPRKVKDDPGLFLIA